MGRLWVHCDWHKLGAKLYNKLPVAPYMCTNVENWIDGLVDGRKERCKDAYRNVQQEKCK